MSIPDIQAIWAMFHYANILTPAGLSLPLTSLVMAREKKNAENVSIKLNGVIRSPDDNNFVGTKSNFWKNIIVGQNR